MGSENARSKTIFSTIRNLDRFIDIIIADEQRNWRKY